MTTTKPNTGNESPASVTYSITSRDGFNALFTLREETGEALLSKMAVVEAKLLALLYKPQIRPVFGAKKEVTYVEGKVCPLDGGKLIKAISKAGKEYHKCENGKFDFATKQTSGCTFVDWLNPPKPTTPMTIDEYEDYQANYKGE